MGISWIKIDLYRNFRVIRRKKLTFSRGLHKILFNDVSLVKYERFHHPVCVFIFRNKVPYYLGIFARRKFLFQLLAAVKTLSNAVAIGPKRL
jgi:hypothetical protein